MNQAISSKQIIQNKMQKFRENSQNTRNPIIVHEVSTYEPRISNEIDFEGT